jgi:hypothetical protein
MEAAGLGKRVGDATIADCPGHPGAYRGIGQGTMIFHPDTHHEDEFHTKTGGEILIVHIQIRPRGGRPIYEDRFNLQERRSISAERTDR